MNLTKDVFLLKNTSNAGNFSTEMEGNIPWILLSFLLFMHVCEGKSFCTFNT